MHQLFFLHRYASHSAPAAPTTLCLLCAVPVHDMQPFSAREFNLTHTIRHLSFGQNVPGRTDPLDGLKSVAEKGEDYGALSEASDRWGGVLLLPGALGGVLCCNEEEALVSVSYQ